jgi:electron transfer flavoprotein beta subunit
MNLIVFIKQVPMVSELPWDKRTGRLKRERSEGMMNPACRHALEVALELKDRHGGDITVISMGPPAAEEVLREALAMGADRAVLLSDPRLAGADTPATSYTLSLAVRAVCPDYDLLLLGCHSSDSETGQVGPHLAEELGLPGPAYVESLEVEGRTLTVERYCDGFWETLEMDLPALVTITTQGRTPRDIPLSGMERAFAPSRLTVLNATDLKADLSLVGWAGSASRILRVYSPTADKKGLVMSGAPKKCAAELLDRFGDRLVGLIGKDLVSE